jgi:transposase
VWTTENRPRYNRDRLRYPSNLTDEEWVLVEPLLAPGKPDGGKRRVNLREVVNGVMYILSTGCQWRYLPKNLPPRSTVHDYLSLWNWDGTLDRIHHELYVQDRDGGLVLLATLFGQFPCRDRFRCRVQQFRPFHLARSASKRTSRLAIEARLLHATSGAPCAA